MEKLEKMKFTIESQIFIDYLNKLVGPKTSWIGVKFTDNDEWHLFDEVFTEKVACDNNKTFKDSTENMPIHLDNKELCHSCLTAMFYRFLNDQMEKN